MRRAVLLLVCAIAASPARAQISPGPLSAAHEHLEGIRQCSKCHGGGGENSDARCLDCHGAIAWLIAEGRGLHAGEGASECAGCHPEHAGRDFELVDWDGPVEEFEHRRTGWILAGSHARLRCERCHRADHRKRNLLLRRPEGAGEETWLGLDRSTCKACHASPHSARLGDDCTACHSEKDWREVRDFDHAKTAWALTGRHATLECAACHRNGRFGTSGIEGAEMHYAPIAHAECAPCHKDPHAGRFGPACAGCHVTSDFRKVPEGRFQHARTRFPLRGAHDRVACDRCHDPARGGWGPRPAFDRCAACHADPHAGTASAAGQEVDCDHCHGEESFRRSTFDLAMHARSDYPLLGRHAPLECGKCHRRDLADPRFGPAGIDLRPAADRCQDCHADEHAGQFGERYGGGACESCHVVEGWLPSTFDLGRHGQTGFALEGAHAKATCKSCHAFERAGLPPHDIADAGAARVVMTLSERLCGDCHGDVHRARYTAQSCTECHSQDRFVPSTVDAREHDRFGFRLEGAHRTTPCFLCHRQLDSTSHIPEGTHALILQPLPEDVVLWGIPTACQGCHRTEVYR